MTHLYPGGMSAISRWLSVSDTTGWRSHGSTCPGGTTDKSGHNAISRSPRHGDLASRRDAIVSLMTVSGGVADAQPPANCCSPSGTNRIPACGFLLQARRTDRHLPSTDAVNFERWNTADQRKWLDAIKDHIASSLNIEQDDLEEVPFNQIGGIGKAYELFGDQLSAILDELNMRLAA